MGYNIVYINVDCWTFIVCLWPRSVFLFNEKTRHFTILRCIKCAWQQNAFENSKTANVNTRYSVVVGYMSWAYILRLLMGTISVWRAGIFNVFFLFQSANASLFRYDLWYAHQNESRSLFESRTIAEICSFWWYRVRLHFGKTDWCKQAYFILRKVIDLGNRIQCDQFQLTVWILLNVVLFFLYVNHLIWYVKYRFHVDPRLWTNCALIWEI